MPTHNPAPHSDLPVPAGGPEDSISNIDRALAAVDKINAVAAEMERRIVELETALRVAEQERDRLRDALEEITERSSYPLNARIAFDDAIDRARKALALSVPGAMTTNELDAWCDDCHRWGSHSGECPSPTVASRSPQSETRDETTTG